MSANPPPFKVSCSQATLGRLRALTEQAERLGILNEFLETLNSIHGRLEEDPLGWGDPQYRLHKLDLLMHHGIRDLVEVYYAVDETRRIVYVREFNPLPGHPLAQTG